MVKELSNKEKEQKKRLIKEINNHKQTMWIGIIMFIFTFWTIIGGLAGIIIALIGHELKQLLSLLIPL